ncbi:hypothetical protein DID88_008241 [Monilinia fructigena]|uniref:Prephenate dehydratase domain-containing protein n=1 Tax=Monilinia fructigena TaxID=38457 RepID=A0A395J5F3_9HELO|nr:hypothetical protein DID88_008241 [Monilinia fructigena]
MYRVSEVQVFTDPPQHWTEKEDKLNDAVQTNLSSTPAISFLGPASSYTHQAALGCFDKEKYNYQPVFSIPDVFEAVQSGQAELGVVPFENSTNEL